MTELAKPNTPPSRREHEMLRLLVSCRNYVEVGQRMGITATAVASLARRAMSRTGTAGLFQLGMWAARHGYDDPRLACVHEACSCGDVRCGGDCQ